MSAANPTKSFYDRISHAYDLIADGGEHEARQRGLELLNIQPGESVLEIGFGTGHTLVALAKAVGPSGHVVGIDISTGMRDVAKNRLRDENCENLVRLLVQPVPPVPLESASVDAVTMSFTLELFPLHEIPTLLAECRRVLKPHGRLGVVSMATVDEGERASMLEKTYVWMHNHFPHIVDCQPIPLEDLLTSAGFSIQQKAKLEIFTMPVAAMVGIR
ncbi:MAG: methyltransferase domain-containing protein [Planctomycetales bacterium]|nr:methyltransferase domain-containing protein [Planctomycetales bacterium]